MHEMKTSSTNAYNFFLTNYLLNATISILEIFVKLLLQKTRCVIVSKLNTVIK